MPSSDLSNRSAHIHVHTHTNSEITKRDKIIHVYTLWRVSGLQRKEKFMEQVPVSCSLNALFLQEEAESQK